MTAKKPITAIALTALLALAAMPTAAAQHPDAGMCGAEEVRSCTITVNSLGGFEGEPTENGKASCVLIEEGILACVPTEITVEFQVCSFNAQDQEVCAAQFAQFPRPEVPAVAIEDLVDPACFPIGADGFYCVTTPDTGEEVTLHANTPTVVTTAAPVPVFTG